MPTLLNYSKKCPSLLDGLCKCFSSQLLSKHNHREILHQPLEISPCHLERTKLLLPQMWFLHFDTCPILKALLFLCLSIMFLKDSL